MAVKEQRKPQTMKERIFSGELTAFWCARAHTVRFHHKRSEFSRNEVGQLIERMPPGDSAVFTTDPSIGAGFWYLTSDPQEVESLRKSAETSRPPCKVVEVTDILNWRPPFEPLTRQRVINPL